ncbi:MAG: molybdopterin-binding protein, partial [Sedimentisphaerales bacterium]|nr:molybdopterin-binding protein [Sedimentisphaerales bacterium]
MISNKATVISTNSSATKGTSKTPVPELNIDRLGAVGDAHAGPWHRQISLLSGEIVEHFSALCGRTFAPGDFAENITTRGIDLSKVAPLDRLTIGSVELEVVQIGKKCHGDGCAIYQQVGKCVMPAEGIFCRVISPGKVRPGDAVTLVQKTLRILVVTVSDRASRGEYEDRSGPELRRLIEEFFGGKRWHIEIQHSIIPDEAERLKDTIRGAVNAHTDIIFTTGGTGIGPRDITPESIISLADKMIPGIMEYIRCKYGEASPN